MTEFIPAPYFPRFNDPHQCEAYMLGKSEEGAIWPFAEKDGVAFQNPDWLNATYEIGFTTIKEKPHTAMRKAIPSP